MNIRRTTEIVRFRLYKCPSKFRILNDFAGFCDDLFLGSIVICLRDVDVDELIASIDGCLASFYCRAMVKVYLHLDTILVLIVVHEVT